MTGLHLRREAPDRFDNFRQQQASKEFPINSMRHYYDIYGLLQRPEVQAFIGTADGRSEFWGNEMALGNTAQPQVPAKAAAQCHADSLWQEGCAKLKWMVSAGMRASILMVVGLAVGGCAQLGRLAAVSAEETGGATVLGIPDARFLPSDGDRDRCACSTSVRTRGQILCCGRSASPAGIHPRGFRRRR
jgi:hypothetical protein